MANTLESIPDALGKLRKGLIEEDYSPEQAFQIVLDLIRRGDSPFDLLGHRDSPGRRWSQAAASWVIAAPTTEEARWGQSSGRRQDLYQKGTT